MQRVLERLAIQGIAFEGDHGVAIRMMAYRLRVRSCTKTYEFQTATPLKPRSMAHDNNAGLFERDVTRADDTYTKT